MDHLRKEDVDCDAHRNAQCKSRPYIDHIKALELFHKYYGLHTKEVVAVQELKSHTDRNFRIVTKIITGKHCEESNQSTQDTSSMFTKTHDSTVHTQTVTQPCDKHKQPITTAVLNSRNNQDVVLKVTLTEPDHVTFRKDMLDKQFSVMNYVRKMGYRCSELVMNNHGNHCEIEEIHKDGLQQLCLVYAVTYLDGVPVLDRYENDGIPPDVLADMGTLLASWRNIMKVYNGESCPSSSWSLDNVDSFRQQVISLQDDNKRCLAYKVLDAFEERILPDIDTFEQGIIHGDFHDENVIILDSGSCTDDNSEYDDVMTIYSRRTEPNCGSSEFCLVGSNTPNSVSKTQSPHSCSGVTTSDSSSRNLKSVPGSKTPKSYAKTVGELYGIIDFADTGHGPYVFDLATPVAFFMISAPGYPGTPLPPGQIAGAPERLQRESLYLQDDTPDFESQVEPDVLQTDKTVIGSHCKDDQMCRAPRGMTDKRTPGPSHAAVYNASTYPGAATLGADFISAGGQFLKGYIRTHAVTQQEWQVLYLTVCAAYVRELVVGEFDFKEQGGTNDYVITSVSSGWSQLEVLWQYGEAEVVRRWRDMCEDVIVS